MDHDYSSDGLLTFLREVTLAGRMAPALARSRRAAAQALFAKLNEDEAADLRGLDVDTLKSRFLDMEADGDGLRIEVLELYVERLNGALDDYFRFREAPDSFTANAARSHSTSLRGKGLPRSSEERALEAVRLSAPRQRPDVIPVPLQQGRVVYLHGIPADLTAAEASKICRVVTALASESGDDD